MVSLCYEITIIMTTACRIANSKFTLEIIYTDLIETPDVQTSASDTGMEAVPPKLLGSHLSLVSFHCYNRAICQFF